MPKAEPPDVDVTVRAIAKKLNHYGHRKPGHLLTFGLAMLKYLALYGESDNIRLQAAKAILDVPTIRQLSGNIRTKTTRELHLHQHVNGIVQPAPNPAEVSAIEQKLAGLLSGGGAQAKQALEALEAELSEPNPNETKGNQ